MRLDFNLMQLAMAGDEQAARIYCGDYWLVRKLPVKWRDREKVPHFRCPRDKMPEGYDRVLLWHGKPVHDEYGFLLPYFWSLPRLGIDV